GGKASQASQKSKSQRSKVKSVSARKFCADALLTFSTFDLPFPYIFNNRILPLLLERSTVAPPEPITPSRECLLPPSSRFTLKSVWTVACDVWAWTRAPILAGSLTVIPPLLVPR